MEKMFYIIADESAVRSAAGKGDGKAGAALLEIGRIKAADAPRKDIGFSLWGMDLRACGIPENDDGLHILVAGAYGNQCCALDVAALRKAGYRADFHFKGTYDQGRIVGPALIDEVKKHIPEYPLNFE